MSNYPLTKLKSEELNRNHMIDYLSIFDYHTFSLVKLTPEEVISRHSYKDGLHIEVYWSFTSKTDLSSFVIEDICSLIVLMDKGIIRFQQFTYLGYSDPAYLLRLNPVAAKRFDILMNRTENLTYHDFEYKVQEPTSIPDFFFDDLLYCVSQNTKFEKMYGEG